MDDVESSTDEQEPRFVCTKCGEEKPANRFHSLKRSKTGHAGQCKECCAKARALLNFPSVPDDTFLRCTQCKEEKPAKEFYRDKHNKTGRNPACKECASRASKLNYRENREAILARQLPYRIEHREEARIRARIWLEANLERAAATKKAYAEAYAEEIRAYKARWFQEHRDECLAKGKKRREEKREEILAQQRIYSAAHSEENKARAKAWNAAHPEVGRAVVHGRHARLRNAPSEKFTDLQIFERDLWVCQICHKKVDKRLKFPDTGSASLDHVIPVSKGGGHTWQNCVLAHFGCNSGKNNRAVPQQQRLF